MRSIRRAIGAGVALPAFAALAFSADLEGSDLRFERRGGNPIYCASIAADRQICTWHEGRSHHYVCELDAEGRRIGESCFRQEDNTSMVTFPRSVEKYSGRWRRMKKKEVCEAEFAALEAVQSVREVSEFVGAGPKSCSVDGERLVCTWHAARRTPGYVSLARITRTPGKKVDMTCEFKDHGQTRESGTCRAYSADEAPPDADQAPDCQ
jgi:hypothetical protein